MARAAVAALAQSAGKTRPRVHTPLGVRRQHAVVLLTTLMLTTPGAFIAPGAATAEQSPTIPAAASSLPAVAATAAPAAVGAASPATVPLSGLTPVSVVNGYGPMSRNRSNGGLAAGDGGQLTVNGRRYSHGLGVAAHSGVTFRLGAQYSTFSTAIGVDDEVGNHGRVTFELWADGTRRFVSPAYTGRDAARQLTISVVGVRTLGLTVPGAQGGRYDHADWAGATLTRRATAPFSRSIVHFGDSVPSGWACRCTPYPGLHASLASRRTGDQVVATNLARAGYTSVDVRRQVESAPSVAAIRRAEAVVLMIGANDFGASFGQVWHGARPDHAYAPVAARVQANLTSTIARVRVIHRTPVRIVVLGYWNVMKDGNVARAAYGPAGVKASNEATAYANNAILRAARAKGATYVSTYGVFKGADGKTDPTPLLAADGDHPNARGHQRIAQALARALPTG
jgi:acyl-CoA thioesterase-1